MCQRCHKCVKGGIYLCAELGMGELSMHRLMIGSVLLCGGG
jgi:hypothetical protein